MNEYGRLGYGMSMLLATLAAGYLYRRQSSASELTPLQKWGIAIGGFIGATFAAKIPFVLADDGTHGVLAAWMSDGKTVLWALAGGYLGVEAAKWSLYVRARTGDRFVIPVAAAIAIGRTGCLCQGCCFGIPTDQSWGIRSLAADGGEILRHPAPLYETLFHLGFALLACNGIRHGWLKTQWMLLYLIAYCGFRFVSETWREEPVWLAGMTFYQCSSILIGSVFLILLLQRRYLPLGDGQRRGETNLG